MRVFLHRVVNQVRQSQSTLIGTAKEKPQNQAPLGFDSPPAVLADVYLVIVGDTHPVFFGDFCLATPAAPGEGGYGVGFRSTIGHATIVTEGMDKFHANRD